MLEKYKHLICVLIVIYGMALAVLSVKAHAETVAGLDPEAAVQIMYNMEQAEKESREAKEKAEQEEQRQRNIEMLAHLVNCENATYESRLYTGSVVINRVESELFPDSIEDVIWQKGQYACLIDGHYWRTPDEESYDIAEFLVDNGSAIPSKVLYAAEFKQGTVWDKVDGTYYCY